MTALLESNLTNVGSVDLHAQMLADPYHRPASGDWSALQSDFSSMPKQESNTMSGLQPFHPHLDRATSQPPEDPTGPSTGLPNNSSPPVSENEAYARAVNLSKKLWSSNIPTQISPTGDLMLDMSGSKTSEEQALRTAVMARKIFAQ